MVAHGLADQRDLARLEAGQAGVEDEVARVLVVVVVVDGHADVVQQRRRPQQLALDRVARVEPRGGELVEEAEREARRRARCAGCASGSMPYCAARLTTLARRTSSNSGGSPPRWRSKNTPSRRPGLGDLERLEAAGLHHRLHDDRAGEDEVAARGLDARDLGALGRRAARPAARRGRRAPRARARSPGRRTRARSRSRCAAAARLRTVPPMPTSRAAERPQPRRRARACRRRAPRSSLELLGLGRAVAGEEALGHAHRAQRPGVELARVAARRRARAASSRRRGRARRRRPASSS